MFLTATFLLVTKYVSSPTRSLNFPERIMAMTTNMISSTSSLNDNNCSKPRILCLHGKFQSASTFSNKIGGARRKIAKHYDLHFVDGPILLPKDHNDNDEDISCDDLSMVPRAWWLRSEDGKHTLVRDAFEYITTQTETESYDAIIGFSQGGTLATALALSGSFPNVRAVLTAGAPFIPEVFETASELARSNDNDWSIEKGLEIPKMHLAGETDTMVSVEWTTPLCEKGGNGKLIVHEQGHLFPTRSARVKEMLDFLDEFLN